MEKAVEKVGLTVGSRGLNLLINNAGVFAAGNLIGEIEPEGLRAEFEVNAFAPFLITKVSIRTVLYENGVFQ